MRKIGCFLLVILSMILPFHAIAALVDHGSYTTITQLGIDVYDVSTFFNMTHQEVLNNVAIMNNGWQLAAVGDVDRIYQSMDEPTYVNSFRFLTGYYTLEVNGTTYFNTIGRVSDTWPDLPGVNYLAGFGNGIQHINPPNPVEYIWSSFGIGWEGLGETRSGDWGAWVIRTSPIPLPGAAWLLGTGLIGLIGLKSIRRR